MIHILCGVRLSFFSFFFCMFSLDAFVILLTLPTDKRVIDIGHKITL